MPPASFRKISRSFRWLQIAIFGGLPLAILLIIALFWGMQLIITQAREKTEFDFAALTTYLHAQERYLRTLQQRNETLPTRTAMLLPEPANQSTIHDDKPYLYQVRPSIADIPYAILCMEKVTCPVNADHPANRAALHAIGDFLSDFYAAYWSRSYFPGATTLLIDGNSDLSLVVPADETIAGRQTLSPQDLLLTVATIRSAAQSAASPSLSEPEIRWLHLPDLPGTIVGYTSAPFPSGVWPVRNTDNNGQLHAATVFNLASTNLLAKIAVSPLYDEFWMLHNDSILVSNNGAPPPQTQTGTDLTLSGVVFGFTDASGSWLGVYKVRYSTLFSANSWLPLTALGLLVLCTLVGGAYARWYNRRVVQPIQQSHQALHESEAFGRTLLDTAPVALCILSRDDGSVLFANTLAQQWLDIATADDGTRQLPANLLPKDLLHADTLGSRDNLQLHDRTLQVAYAPTRYHRQPALLCAFADVSVRAQYEKALSKAKSEADSANSAKSRFLAAMSHEIRTPLYGILGTMELLSMTQLTPAQRQHLRRLQQSSAILMQLISDILDLTKIEADQMALNMESFCPGRLVQTCVDGFSGMARQKGLQIFACIEPSVPDCVQGDPTRIRQIIYNFLSNAIKFTLSGQVVARLRSQHQPDGSVELVFQVVDSGPGISAEDQTRLFTPFYQVASQNHTSQGTGLGLSISDNLARLMGGDIQVTSELGLGSSFALRITLETAACPQRPAEPDLSGLDLRVRSAHAELSRNLCLWFRKWGAQAEAILPADMPETATASANTLLIDVLVSQPGRPSDWPGKYILAGTPLAPEPDHADARLEGCGADDIARGILRYLQHPDSTSELESNSHAYHELGLQILVAEDNPINQATLRDQLELLGCTVTMTSDGAEALQRWAAASYDIVLTDVNMPRMNGYELTSALRNTGTDVPIIGVTANAMREEENHCRQAGMNAWIVKPINLDTLYHSLYTLAPHKVSARLVPDATTLPVSQIAPAIHDSATSDAISELDLIPAKHRELFRQSMTDDANSLLEAVGSQKPSSIQQALHRMHGALLSMRQQSFAKRVHNAEDALRAGPLTPELEATLLRIAIDLKTVIDEHLPT
ncbi:hybrid sensor histidine kinase/response regulator [Corticimicrobacter populi]|nr:hybrid sensor histidine kinase/response regulator [Corticimicrobacter populi]